MQCAILLKRSGHPHPFGMQMEARVAAYVHKSYKYGFNGKEGDVESFKQCIAFEARIYDSRLGRFLSVDPLCYVPRNISRSPYSISNNNPTLYIDKHGKLFHLPVAIVAGVGGFLWDAGGQLAAGVLSGKSWKESFKDVDWADAVITGVETGLATGTLGTSLVLKPAAAFLRSSIDLSYNKQQGLFFGKTKDEFLIDLGSEFVGHKLGKWFDNKIGKSFSEFVDGTKLKPFLRKVIKTGTKKLYDNVSGYLKGKGADKLKERAKEADDDDNKVLGPYPLSPTEVTIGPTEDAADKVQDSSRIIIKDVQKEVTPLRQQILDEFEKTTK